jgi:hypothetical protein
VQHKFIFIKKPSLFLLSAVVSVSLLNGCSNVREVLGKNKKSPDEFSVLARAPLSVPPNFTLRVPKPGAERPQEPSSRSGGRELIFKTSDGVENAKNGSNATNMRSLLGIDSSIPNIREVLNKETRNIIFKDRQFLDKLLSWKNPSNSDVLVDAAAEAKRIKDNASQGKPVTEGKTPVINRKPNGFLNKLF